MVFSVKSVYTLVGDATMTFFQLSNTDSSGSSNLSTLSTINYPVANGCKLNPENQVVFKNQPLSWWLASLNSGAVKYTPVSSDVNWVYIDEKNNSIHISMEISNLLIPNKTSHLEKAPGSMSSSIIFEAKFGLSRTDTHSI